jgi:hypothetical protein
MIKKVPLATCKTCLSDYQILIQVNPVKISESIAGTTKEAEAQPHGDKPYYYYNCYYCDKTSAPAPTVQEAAFKWNELNQ